MQTKNKTDDFDIQNVWVEISETVKQRMKKLVSSSNVEEGGKFIGTIKEQSNKIIISVESYIDSGAKVNNSSTHIYPDSNYQYEMFQYIYQKFNPEIEHIGTWHSHHCNGLKELSNGDIDGYYLTVNKTKYNVPYFFALLVTGISFGNLQIKYYLFTKDSNEYYELPSYKVKYFTNTPTVAIYDKLLEDAELKSLELRSSKSYNTANEFLDEYKNNITKKGSWFSNIFNKKKSDLALSDNLKEIMQDDKKWFASQDFVQVNLHKGLFWDWKVKLNNTFVTIKYSYPKQDENSLSSYATIIATEYNLSETIFLNSFRHTKIEKFVNGIIEKYSNKTENKSNEISTIISQNSLKPDLLSDLGLKEIVLEDKKWFKINFYNANMVLANKNSILWKCSVPSLLITYKYPSYKVSNPKFSRAELEIVLTFTNTSLVKEYILMDTERFDKIKDCLKSAEERLLNLSE